MHVLTRLTAAVLLASTLISVPAQASAPAAPVAAGIKLSPKVGPPTLPFAVQGRGFGANEVVEITFDFTAIGSATTNAAGSFSKKVSVPAAALPGAHTVTATGETSHLTASAGFTVRTNWSKFHFDAANTGYNPFENVLGTGNVSGLVEKWAVPTASGFAAEPVVSGGIVYAASIDGVVRALDPADGSTIWSYDTGGSMDRTAPIVSGGAVYVANDIGKAVALAAGSGQLLWTVDLGDLALGNSVAKGLYYVTGYVGNTGTAYALDASTGATVWSTSPGFAGGNAPVGSGLIYFGTAIPCSVKAFNALTGAFAWEEDLCGELVATQQAGAVSGGVLFGEFDIQMDAVRAPDGHVLWRGGGANGVTSDGAPALANGVAYLADTNLTAFNQATGASLWSQPLGTRGPSSPAVANGVVYVGTNAGTLRAYNALTGSLLWESADLGDQVSSPAVSDGVVYVGTLDGVVHAFALP